MIRVIENIISDNPEITLHLWDGKVVEASSAERLRLGVKSPWALLSLLGRSPLAIGEAFVHGELEIEEGLERLSSDSGFLVIGTKATGKTACCSTVVPCFWSR